MTITDIVGDIGGKKPGNIRNATSKNSPMAGTVHRQRSCVFTMKLAGMSRCLLMITIPFRAVATAGAVGATRAPYRIFLQDGRHPTRTHLTTHVD